jgi:hypothetical protein
MLLPSCAAAVLEFVAAVLEMNCVVINPSPNLDEIAVGDKILVKSRYDGSVGA